MKVVILAGGFGTRLSEETEVIPKPMIEIGGHPLLWHIMKTFEAQGFEDFAVALGYKSEVIKLYFMQYSHTQQDIRVDLATGNMTSNTESKEKWRIDLVNTGRLTMTGGRLKRLRDYIDGTFFFTYSDGLSNVDLNGLLVFHRSHGKLATVTAVRPPQRFGTLKLKDDMVESFEEKRGNSAEYINGGFFVLEPGAIDYIEGGDLRIFGGACSLPTHRLPAAP